MITDANISNGEFLIELSKNPLFDKNIQKRLYSIACALIYRPEINFSPDFRFKQGHTYMSLEGKMILITKEVNDLKGYETVLGSDDVHRYNRSTSDSDIGRVTGTTNDTRNLIPMEIELPVSDPAPKIRVKAGVDALCCDAEEVFKALKQSSFVLPRKVVTDEEKVFIDVMVGGLPMNLQINNGSARKRNR